MANASFFRPGCSGRSSGTDSQTRPNCRVSGRSRTPSLLSTHGCMNIRDGQPTATFRVLFVLVVLSHDRRKILHSNVTESPTADWTARHIVEAVCMDNVPKYPVRYRDRKFSAHFSRQVSSIGLTEVLTAPASPWQNGVRRACHRHDKKRMSGSHDHSRRAALATNRQKVRGLLQQSPHAPFSRKGCAEWAASSISR